MKESISYLIGANDGLGIIHSLFLLSSMCITFILTNETSSIFYSVLNTFNLPNRLHLIPHMVENMTVYPINYLRNIAIDHVKTSHFWLADMDMWPARMYFE